MLRVSRRICFCLYVWVVFLLPVDLQAQTARDREVHGHVQALGAQNTIRSFYDLLLEVMRQGEELTFDERAVRLEPMVRRVFDLPRMTARMMGFLWKRHSLEERRLLVELFSRFTVYNYAYNFGSFFWGTVLCPRQHGPCL